jgi:hypothetical protein
VSEVDDVCAWLLADLTGNILSLADVTQHKNAPWDPERFDVSNGDRHLAVWPMPVMETAAPLTTLSHELTSDYVVAYWEPADMEDERQVADDQAADELFDIRDDIRDRFYELANQVIGDTFKVWYVASETNDATSASRWVLVTFEVHRAKDFG